MEFNNFHKAFFRASEGAYSRVTERENYDSQITLTDIEFDIVVTHFGRENLNMGAVKVDPLKSAKEFLLYPNNEPIDLNLVFPKAEKNELRLYLASKKDFKPIANSIWFLYKDENQNLVIGALEEKVWNNLGQQDSIDETYQEEIETIISKVDNIQVDPIGKIVEIEIAGRKTFFRDPRIAIRRFQESDYTCDINRSHETFIALRSQKPYVEAHHFIPMKFQTLYDFPLDNLDNIISLCPNCHRGIHHGIIEHKFEMISYLYNSKQVLRNHGFEEVAQFYNCFKVPEE